MDAPRRTVAGYTSSTPCKKNVASTVVAPVLRSGLDAVGHVFPPYIIPSETTINAARYQDMLRSYCDPCANRFCGIDAVFRQGGAPSHAARTARTLLGEVFRENLAWPALSPDLSPNDYALWSSRESLVAQENPADATTLRPAPREDRR